MENDRHGAGHANQIPPIIQQVDFLEEFLIQAIGYTDGPANTARATIIRIYTVLKIITLLLILKMGNQNMDPRFRHVSTLITVALGCIKCGLLMYVLLGDMPWLIFALCVLMLFTFIAN